MKKNKSVKILLLIVIAAVLGIIGFNVINNRIILSKLGSEFDKPTYKKIAIAGDVYEYPFTVQDLYDNGWEVEDYDAGYNIIYAGAPSKVDSRTTAENISLVRKHKKIRIEVYNPANRTAALEDCLVSRLRFPDLNRPKVVLPGNYEFGGHFPVEDYERYLTNEYSNSSSSYEEYVIPFVGADEHECQLKITYDVNLQRFTELEYTMRDLVVDINVIIGDLDWNLEEMFYNGEKDLSIEDVLSPTTTMNNIVGTLNDSRIVDSIIYVSGFDDEVIKDTNGDLAKFINNVEDTVEWNVYKVDDDTIGINYTYPDSLEKMGEKLDSVLEGYDGDDYSVDQDLFDEYAKRLAMDENFKMSEGRLEVDVINGEITGDDYTQIYLTLFGLGELFEE